MFVFESFYELPKDVFNKYKDDVNKLRNIQKAKNQN